MPTEKSTITQKDRERINTAASFQSIIGDGEKSFAAGAYYATEYERKRAEGLVEMLQEPETKTHFVKLELEGIRPLSEEEAFKGILDEEKPEDQIEDFVVNAAKNKAKPETHIDHVKDWNILQVATTGELEEINLPCESVTEITLKAEKGKTIVVKWI